MDKLKLCPVCGKKFLKQGLKNHIINSAEGETFRQFNGILNGKGSFKMFSPYVVLRNNKHLAHYRKNIKIIDKKELKI